MKTAVSHFVQHSVAVAGGLVLGTAALLLAQPAEAFVLVLDPAECADPARCTTDDYTYSTAEYRFDFRNGDSGSVWLDLTLANTTLGTSTLVGAAFDFPSQVAFDFNNLSNYYNANSTDYTLVFEDPTLQPFGSFDIGIRTNANGRNGNNSFAGGNPRGGLLAGESATVSFRFDKSADFSGSFDADTVSTYFYQAYASGELRASARFQQVGENGEESDKVLATIRSITEPPKEVPEPMTLAGLGLVAGSLLVTRRRLGR